MLYTPSKRSKKGGPSSYHSKRFHLAKDSQHFYFADEMFVGRNDYRRFRSLRGTTTPSVGGPRMRDTGSKGTRDSGSRRTMMQGNSLELLLQRMKKEAQPQFPGGDGFPFFSVCVCVLALLCSYI